MALTHGSGNTPRRNKAFTLLVAFLGLILLGAAFADVSIENITTPANSTISQNRPDLNFTTNVSANITYSWNGEGNISGCRDCTSYNTTFGENNGSDSNLVGLWHLNENAGTVVYDDDNSSNNLTRYGATFVTGKFGKALDFNGVSDSVNVSDPADGSLDFGTGDFSISLWVKTTANAGGNQPLVNKKIHGNGDGYSIYYGINENARALIGDGSTQVALTGAIALDDGIWHHVVAVFDRSDKVTLYVDTIVDGTPADITGVGDQNNALDFAIGGDDGIDKWFSGSIDEVAIFNRTLSLGEVQALYNRTLPDGQHNVTIYANDTNGNLNSTTRVFTVDTAPPTITVTSPQNTSYNTTSISLDVSADEPIDTWWYEYNANSSNIAFMPNSTLIAGGTDGLKNVTVYANDSAGNLNYSTVYFTVDTTQPTWVFDANTTNTTLAGNDTVFSLQIQDNLGLSYCYIATNNTGTWQNGSIISITGTTDYCNQTITLNTTVGVNITWSVWFNDTAGNVNSTQNFTIMTTVPVIDNTPPTITIVSPTNTSYPDDVVDLNVSADEPIDTWWYNLNSNATSNVTFTNKTIKGIIDSNKLVVYANDSSGNKNSSTVYFTVEKVQQNVTKNVNESILTTIDLKNESKLVIEIMPNVNATVNFTIEASTNATLLNASDLTASLDQNQKSLGRFVSINVSGIANNASGIQWVKINLYYDDSDLDKNGDGEANDPGDINENSLKMYWYCDNCSGTQKWFQVTQGSNLVSNGGPEVHGTGREPTLNYTWANLSHFSSYGGAGNIITGPPSRSGVCSRKLHIRNLEVKNAAVGSKATLFVTAEKTGDCMARDILVWVPSLPPGWTAENKTLDIEGLVVVNLTLEIPESEEPGRRPITVELTPKEFIGSARQDMMVGVRSELEMPVVTTTTTTVRQTTTTVRPTTQPPTTTVPPQTVAPPSDGALPLGKTALAIVAIAVIAGGAYLFLLRK